MIKKLIIVLGVIIPTLVSAQDTSTYRFSLAQSVDFSFKNHSSVVNAQIDEIVAKAQKNEIRGIGLPQINGSVDFKDFIELATQLVPAEFFGGQPGEFAAVQFGTQYNTTASLEASQLLFSGDYLVALQSSSTFLELSKKNTQRTKIETALAISKAYYNVLVQQERMKLINANVDRIKKLHDETFVMHDKGIVEKIDLDRVKVAYNNITTEKGKFEKLLILSYTMLKFQMGMDPAAKLILTDSLTEDGLEVPKSQISDFNFSSRIEYSILETRQQLSNLELRKHRLGYTPTLIAYGSYSWQAQRNEFNFFDSNEKWFPIGVVGVKLTLPIFDGLQRNYRIQQSKLSIQKVDNDIKLLEDAITVELQSANIKLENSMASIANQKENMALAEGVYEAVKRKYELGTGSSIEVMDAETTLKEAQTNYYAALYDALVAKIELEKAKGTLIK